MDRTALDREFGAHVTELPDLGRISAATLPAFRAQYPPPRLDPLSDAVERTDHVIRSGGPTIRVHRPVDADGPLPCLYWMHGGGLVLGDRSMDDLRFDSWCRRHRMMAVSVEYRLAPETPYPGALHDCHYGLRWVADHTASLGVRADRIGIGGASAGGGLAAALALLARDAGTVDLAFQLLVYPMLDDRQITYSSQVEALVWPPSANAFGWRAYLGDRCGTAAVDAYAAPARATDLGGLPPAYVTVGGLDGFLDEDVDYAARLLHAGVPTDLRVYPGLPHGFDGLAPRAEATALAQRDLHEWLGRALHG